MTATDVLRSPDAPDARAPNSAPLRLCGED
jgi:hypothetical protein